MKPHLQCAEQQVSRSNLTKYCACHAERLTYLIIITYETSFTMRGATGVTIQPHQILRLSRRKTRILSPHRIWNVIYSARSNRCHHPTSPNTAPATKNDSTALSSSHMKCHFQCAEQPVSLSNLTKYCACHEKWHCKISKKISKNRWNVISNAGPIRPWSEHDPSMIRPWSDHENANRNPPRNRGYFSSSPRAFSFGKYNVSRPILHSNLHQILRLPRKVPLELHQILRLPRKVTLELHHVLRLPRKVTLELHQVLRLPRKVTLELHQVLRLPRKVTLELHQILRLSRRKTHILKLSPHRIWNVIYSARSNRCHHPTSPNTAPAPKNDSTALSSSHMKGHFQCAEQQVSLSNLTKYCACHEKWHCKISKKISKNRWNVISNAGPIRPWSEHDPSMIRPWKRKPQPASQPRLLFELTTSIFYLKIQRFAPNLTFKPSPNTAPATKSATWTSPNTAPATKSDSWTSPSTAPATKSDTWTSPSTAPATKSNTWTSPSTAPATKSDTWTSPNIAPTTKSNTWTSPSTAPATKSDTWSSPSTAPVTQKDSHT